MVVVGGSGDGGGEERLSGGVSEAFKSSTLLVELSEPTDLCFSLLRMKLWH